MRRTFVLLAAALAVAVPTALAGGGKPGHEKPGHEGKFPVRIALPDGFAPEGIEIKGKTVYVGSVASGAIWKGDLRKGTGDVFIPGVPGSRAATGIEYDRGRIWAAGAAFGNVLVHDAKTKALLHTIPLATAPTFINDLVVTKRAVWLTDSQKPVLYKIELSKGGEPGAVTTVPLSGDYAHVAGFNLNGIVATKRGDALIAVQSAAKKLYAIDPDTGAAKLIDLGGYDLTNGDGLLLKQRTLYVVQNRDNKVAVVRLSRRHGSGDVQMHLTDPDFDVPTTIDDFGKRLYAVNARFRPTPPPPDFDYWLAQFRKVR
jgi:sugar lactone lactonase YvrE